jgi:hypothetical protein
LSDMYVHAWHDAISSVMEDCGWSYEEPARVPAISVERIRTGRPRVIHGGDIEAQLARAVKAVNDSLDSILVSNPTLAARVETARHEEPVAFAWRITETYSPTDDETRTMVLLDSSYIDLTRSAKAASSASN